MIGGSYCGGRFFQVMPVDAAMTRAARYSTPPMMRIQ
jgi:hypothetical protein